MFSNKGYSVDIEDKIFQRKIKVIAKELEIYVFGIVKYSIRSESGFIISLRDQAYYITGLTKYLRIISPQGIHISEGEKVTFIDNFYDEHDIYVYLNFKEVKSYWRKVEPMGRVQINYHPNNNPRNHCDLLTNHR